MFGFWEFSPSISLHYMKMSRMPEKQISSIYDDMRVCSKRMIPHLLTVSFGNVCSNHAMVCYPIFGQTHLCFSVCSSA